MSAATPKARQKNLPLTDREAAPSASPAPRLLKELRIEIANANDAIERMRRNVDKERRALQTRNDARAQPRERQTTTHWHLCRLPGLEAA